MTTTAMTTATVCPRWCTVEHDKYPRDATDPLHLSEGTMVGTHDGEDDSRWAHAQLIRDGGVVRISIGDELEIRPEVAAEPVLALPRLIEQARRR